MDKPEQFDADGRDPEVVKFLKFHADRTGQSFCREDVPPTLTIGEFWEEVERRGELITGQNWLNWRRWLPDASAGLRRYIGEREAGRGPDDAFVRFMRTAATLPTSSPTPTQAAQPATKQNAALTKRRRCAKTGTMNVPPTLAPKSSNLEDERALERAVDRVIEHYVAEIERQHGRDDDFVKFMRSPRRTAVIPPFST